MRISRPASIVDSDPVALTAAINRTDASPSPTHAVAAACAPSGKPTSSVAASINWTQHSGLRSVDDRMGAVLAIDERVHVEDPICVVELETVKPRGDLLAGRDI